MLLDHIGYLLFPHLQILRWLGRLAFPIFAFMIANGYCYSRDPGKYLLRLLLFAAVFQYPYQIMMSDTHLSVLLTLVSGLAAIWLADIWEQKIARKWLAGLCGLLTAGAFAFLAEISGMDYGWYGIMLIYSAWLFMDKFSLLAAAWILINAAAIAAGWQQAQLLSLLSLIPLAFYNRQRGKYPKWFFYIFYPGHIFLLYLLKIIIF